MNAEIRLTDWEIRVATRTGIEREQYGQQHGWKVKFDEPRGEERHVIGCLGEIAVAKALNLYWPMTIGTDRVSGDLRTASGQPIQVRASDRVRDDGKHFPTVLSHDARDQLYVFVVVQLPNVYIKGWIEGLTIARYAELHENDPRYKCKTWRIPVDQLLPIDKLRA